MPKVLWLASWFPNKYKPLTGDFIKRHAEATSLYQAIHVIHVEKIINTQKTEAKREDVTDTSFPQLSYITRYYSVWYLFGIERIYSYLYSLWLYHSEIKRYIKINGKPDILHVNIAMRCGLVALYYKWVHKIPYIITEQFTSYLPEAKAYQPGVNLLNYIPLQLIFRKAKLVIAVSETLAQALQKRFRIKRIRIIYNVVNTSIFFPLQPRAKNKVPVFIHISTLTEQKNPTQMLEAFALLKHSFHVDFILWIIGPSNSQLAELVLRLHISENVVWHKENTQQHIASLIQQADALVLYSRFETFGCVNIEAIACGIPVIVTDIPVFREYLQDGFTAYFAEKDSPMQLAITLNNFLQNENKNSQLIAAEARNFDYETIGKKIHELYIQILHNP